ncbi:hydrogenase [Desulfosarcina sp. OttesenSCG-928-A07]|nr:hydrogenase [Desulfosarcina sp. OttesenSCG-928-G17]MDL2329118.1 hydrogenase [Desulfosarcina sp. OttesenSCG-928-A07]
MAMELMPISNGVAVSRKKVPHLSFRDFADQTIQMVSDGGKVVQFFAYPDEGGKVRLMTVLRKSGDLFAAGCDAPDVYPALSAEATCFHLFEREIAEQYGIRPDGHPWLKMVRYHANYRGVTDVFGNDYAEDIPGRYPYYTVSGEGVHEVAVGPVHAGVIEPGHFRFNCIGERVLNLEIQLGYQHRGIEPLLTTVDPKRLSAITENIAGDTTIGHSLCHAQAMEALMGLVPDDGAQTLRTLSLELERLANHVGDLGAISGDVAFLPPANYCGRMRGDFLNMTLLICGNRFGKGLVRAGGVRFSLTEDLRHELAGRLGELKPQVRHVLSLLMNTPSVRARLEDCGRVSFEDADNLGLVGPAGRACGHPYDVRRVFPTAGYTRLDIPEYSESTGDVWARVSVRCQEVLQSIGIVESLLETAVDTTPVHTLPKIGIAADSLVVTLNEAWRGEASHCILTDSAGRLLRYKIKDPSFHNWHGLSMALRNTGISDFPLNNKSHNLSYCGFDV